MRYETDCRGEASRGRFRPTQLLMLNLMPAHRQRTARLDYCRLLLEAIGPATGQSYELTVGVLRLSLFSFAVAGSLIRP
jgi:hypothetical protein